MSKGAFEFFDFNREDISGIVFCVFYGDQPIDRQGFWGGVVSDMGSAAASEGLPYKKLVKV